MPDWESALRGLDRLIGGGIRTDPNVPSEAEKLEQGLTGRVTSLFGVDGKGKKIIVGWRWFVTEEKIVASEADRRR